MEGATLALVVAFLAAFFVVAFFVEGATFALVVVFLAVFFGAAFLVATGFTPLQGSRRDTGAQL